MSDNNGLRKDVREAIEGQVAEVPIEGAPFSFNFPADHEPADEREGLLMAADYMTNFGMMIAQAGVALAQAAMSCPRDDAAPEELIDHMRNVTAGATADAPVPVTVLAYMGRTVTNDRILANRPEVEELLAILEGWAKGLMHPTYRDLRSLYSQALALTTHDVDTVSKMLEAIRKSLEKHGPA